MGAEEPGDSAGIRLQGGDERGKTSPERMEERREGDGRAGRDVKVGDKNFCMSHPKEAN